ncbi:MAG: SHD1 domain-containing protein [Planctomycetota bacterium]|nr:SHD1 domain-containing protein [Planctomycetota bacterium]
MLHILVRHGALGFRLLSLIVVLTTTSRDSYAQAGGELRYKWQPNATLAYEIEVTADTPAALETYKGHAGYTLDGSEGGQFKLTCTGGLIVSKTPKGNASSDPWDGPRFRGPPRLGSNPFPGLGRCTTKFSMTPPGEIRTMEGSSQLPCLLGHLSLLVIEHFPEANQQSWKQESGVAIVERDEDDRRFGPRFGPFATAPKEKQSAGSISTSYTIAESQGDLVVINKQFQLRSPGGDERFEINGSGPWTFNRTLGVPEKLDFQQQIMVTTKNVTITIPMTIKYHRLSDADWKKVQEEEHQRFEKLARAHAEAKAKADEQAKIEGATPLTRDQRLSLLADVRSGDHWRTTKALDKLAARTPKGADKEIVDAIYAATKSDNVFIRQAAQKALKPWAPDLERKAKLNEAFQGPQDVTPSDRPVTQRTPLPVGLILCVRDFAGWHPVEVRELLSGGKVKVQFRGWGQREGVFARADLRLAPEDLDQPALGDQTAKQLRGETGAESETTDSGIASYRTWMDDTGSFKIEAEFLGVAENKVQLRRKDGREVKVPLARLSKADQEEVKKLQQKAAAANPFEPE